MACATRRVGLPMVHTVVPPRRGEHRHRPVHLRERRSPVARVALLDIRVLLGGRAGALLARVDDVLLLVHLLHCDDLTVPVRVAICCLDSFVSHHSGLKGRC